MGKRKENGDKKEKLMEQRRKIVFKNKEKMAKKNGEQKTKERKL